MVSANRLVIVGEQGAEDGAKLPGSPAAQGEKSIWEAKIDHPDADNVFMSNA